METISEINEKADIERLAGWVVVKELTQGGYKVCNNIRHLTDTGRLADVKYAITSDCLLAGEVGVRYSDAQRLVSPPCV